MSDPVNKINSISIEDFECMKVRNDTFFLCFKGKDTDVKNKSVLSACQRYCINYPNLKFCSIDWLTSKNLKLLKGRSLLYKVLKFENGKETHCVGGFYSKELYELVTSMQEEFDKNERDSKKTLLSEGSKKAGEYKGEFLIGSIHTDKNVTQKHIEKRKKITKGHIYEVTAPNVSVSSVLTHPNADKSLSNYQETGVKKQKMCLRINETIENVPYKPPASSSRQRCSARSVSSIPSNSSERQKLHIQKSLKPKSEPLKRPKALNIPSSSSLKPILSRRTHPTHELSHNLLSKGSLNVLELSPTSSVDSITSVKEFPLIENSPTRCDIITPCYSSALPSYSSSNYTFSNITSQVHGDHTNTRLVLPPISRSSSHQSPQQRQNQSRNPQSGQRSNQGTGLHNRPRRSNSSRSLSSDRVPKSFKNPRRGNCND